MTENFLALPYNCMKHIAAPTEQNDEKNDPMHEPLHDVKLCSIFIVP